MMKRYNLGEQYDAHQMLYAMQEDPNGRWVKNADHEAETKRLWAIINDMSRAIKELADKTMEQEEQLQDQGMIIKASLETIETMREQQAGKGI